MSLTSELVDILTDTTNPDPKKRLKEFLQKCVRVQADVAAIINTPIKRYSSRTSVHLAAVKGLWECLDLLLKYGGDPNVQSGPADLGQTPLHHAAKKGYLQCLNVLLLKHGARMDIKDGDGLRPRDVLAKGRVRCHKVFEHAIAVNICHKPLDERVDVLHQLAEVGDVEGFKMVYSQLPEVPEYRDLALRWTDLNGVTLLYKVTLNKALEDLVEYMLSQSPYQPLHNYQTLETPLVAACLKQNHMLARLLLNHSPGLLFPYESGDVCLPLKVAVCNGDHVLVNLILSTLIESGEYDEDRKLNLDFYDSEGYTPLLHACSRRKSKVVQTFVYFYLKHSSCVTLNVNSPHKGSGRTPLHEATQQGDTAIVEILLSLENIDVNVEAKASKQVHDHVMTVCRANPSCDSTSLSSSYNLASKSSEDQVLQASVTDSGSSSQSETTGLIRSETDPLKHEDCTTHVASQTQFAPPQSPIGIYMSESGKLAEWTRTPGPGYQHFEQLQLTPLAIACALGHKDVVSLLLKGGSRDESGLACRLAFLVQKLEFIQLILSYHCSVNKEKHAMLGEGAVLTLDWYDKKLPCCDAANLSCRYFPNQIGSGVSAKFDSSAIGKVCLNGNHIQEVPIELFQLPNVVRVNLSHNEISRLPVLSVDTESSDLLLGWRCSYLKELNLSHNTLTTLPPNVWCLPSITSLDASHNELSTFEDVEAENLSKTLTILRLTHNEPYLKALPQFVFEFLHLSKVFLDHNRLESLPDSVWKSKSLQELNVSHNHLVCLPLSENVPRSISERAPRSRISEKARHTSSLAESGEHKAHSMTTSTMTIKTLNTFQESQPIIWNIPARVLEGCKYSSLHNLNLSHNKLEDFPEGLPCVTPHLVELDISNNRIKSVDVQFIPPSIKYFTANHCKIEQFGNIISKAAHAQVILNCNHSTPGTPCQHRCHKNLLCLKKLSLSRNSLEHFQLICRDLEKTEDNIDDMRFHMNTPLKDLLYPALETLDLSENNLQGRFNPNIGHQLRLRSLVLDSNHELFALPIELAYLKENLVRLSIKNMPNLFDPPRDYHTVSLHHLLTFMKSRLKESVYYRTIKLFLVGDGMRGKTTLLNRLRYSPFDKHNERTIGIDIAEWTYPDTQRGRKNDQRKPVTFLAWDFAGQESYHTSHQCFYSRRSLYLALFRLSDDIDGVNELEPWLRNIKLRAPGSPVIIVCTHLDRVKRQRAEELEREARRKYCKTVTYFPKVIDVVSINCVQKGLFRDDLERIRTLVYNAACHLQLEHDGISVRYNEKMEEKDPKALFQQQIPKSYLDLQTQILGTAKRLLQERRSPIMEEEEFYTTFQSLFDDFDELKEAVNFLSLQGALLHYKDRDLSDVYFLDPQWLAKLMAKVIRPMENESLVKNGVADISTLFAEYEDQKHLQDKYISLLEKFDVVQKLGDHQVIIPTLMPESARYPETKDIFSDTEMALESFQPPLRRVWFSNFIPNGFWPRLVCRIATDHLIEKVFTTLIYGGVRTESQHFNWIRWKTGLAFVHGQSTLVVIKQEGNDENASQPVPRRAYACPGTHRIIINIYLNEWIQVASASTLTASQQLSPSDIVSLATQLMVKFLVHMKELATHWFPGMIIAPVRGIITSYVPCWKCYSKVGAADTPTEIPSPNSPETKQFAKFIMNKDGEDSVYCFSVDECVVPAALENHLKCPNHGVLDVKHVAPDLIFLDMVNLSSGTVKVDEGIPLGVGAYGFVCKGKHFQREGDRPKDIAMKVFLSDMERLNLNGKSNDELLTASRNPKHLAHAYKEIRQEVSFLSALENPFLIEVFGVRTSPYMCFLLELAPKGSLYSLLEKYTIPLEPLTLKNTALQIAKGLEYLHSHQIVHLDMKSQNVLVWEFPPDEASPKARTKQAGYVWIKIADYGISQVPTRLKFKVGFPPPGTPGYMAPELYDSFGQEISADKVDVFAYGMTLYELLSFHPPFLEMEPIFRNSKIRDKHRPKLHSNESRSILPFKELMTRCWKHDPEDRPNMTQVIRFIDRPEFERLRTQESIVSLSYASVFRVLPEKMSPVAEEEDVTPSVSSTSNQDPSFDPLSPPVRRNVLRDIRSMDSSDDDTFELLNLLQTHGGDVAETEGADRSAKMQYVVEHACTQLWMYSQDEAEGHLQIFMWNDGVPIPYSCSSSSEDLTVLCAVRNTVWMGNKDGVLAIKIFHPPSGTLQCTYTGLLEIPGKDRSTPAPILDICHVEETSSVLVSVQNGDSGEIWIVQDHVVAGSLTVQKIFHHPLCHRLLKSTVQGSVTVWGTMDSDNLLMLVPAQPNTQWKMDEVAVDSEFQQCSLIAQTSFKERDGTENNHIWVSDSSVTRPLLVAVDMETKTTYCKLNCMREFNVDYKGFRVLSMVGSGRRLVVGTNMGTVGIVDAERKKVVKVFPWHKEDVKWLLVLPEEMIPCICAEGSVREYKTKTALAKQFAKSTHLGTETAHADSGGNTGESFPAQKQRIARRATSSASKYYMHNQDMDAPMIASIGEGRSYVLQTKEGLQNSLESSGKSGLNELLLLMWKA